MENGNHQKETSSPLIDSSFSIAFQADEENSAGEIKVRCPKCNEHPQVKNNGHILAVKCPCGFIDIATLLEI